MGKGFNSSISKNAHTKRYERKSENSGRFGSSGASDKRRSGTSDKNQPLVNLVFLLQERESIMRSLTKKMSQLLALNLAVYLKNVKYLPLLI